jgi:two-component system sensor histidine kinase VicK
MADNGQHTNEIWGAMAGAASNIFFIYDLPQNRFIYVNAAFETIIQHKADVLYNNPTSLLDAIHPEDLPYIKKNISQLSTKTVNTLLSFRIARPDGVERWIRLHISPIIENEQVRYLTGEAEDDTARKTGIFNMQKVNGWKNATLHIISHDLRGPIGMVKMLANEVAKHFPNDEHRQARDWLQMIEKISTRNLNLIRNVLSEESLSSAGIAVDKERLDLVWETKELMKFFETAETYIGKSFSYSTSHSKLYACVDPIKYGQIVTNLVDNAIKFTPLGGQIKVHLEQLESTILLTVEDNGVGIPVHLQPMLFNKHTQAGRPGVAGEASTGLGLWIVKTFADAHEGRVWFETEEKRGTKFYVELPIGE